jgi:hypothetical protein
MARAVDNSRLSGYVYIDRNNDGMLAFSDQARPEWVIPGVTIQLFRLTDPAPRSPIGMALTDSVGRYEFSGLAAGIYALHQEQPVEFVDGLDTVGVIRTLSGALSPPLSSVGSTLGANDFVNIALPAGTRGDLYNFGERGLTSAYASRRLLLGTAPPPTFTPQPALLGDLNEDGVVDGADLAQWQDDFGVSAGSDFDGDGDSDGADFLAWQVNLGATASTSSAIAVPEPAVATPAALAAAALGFCRTAARGRFAPTAL